MSIATPSPLALAKAAAAVQQMLQSDINGLPGWDRSFVPAGLAAQLAPALSSCAVNAAWRQMESEAALAAATTFAASPIATTIDATLAAQREDSGQSK